MCYLIRIWFIYNNFRFAEVSELGYVSYHSAFTTAERSPGKGGLASPFMEMASTHVNGVD